MVFKCWHCRSWSKTTLVVVVMSPLRIFLYVDSSILELVVSQMVKDESHGVVRPKGAIRSQIVYFMK